ncbi:MAG: hypothetical protein ABFE07_07635, partial [Armatimonadia bacterium]
DNFSNVHSTILRDWERWTGPRLLHILPQLVLSYHEDTVASEAARTLAAVARLAPEGGEWTMTRRAETYRAWRNRPAEQQAGLPPFIAPDWDVNDPVVAALIREYEAMTRPDYARMLVDVWGPAKIRQGALRALIFEDTDDAWQTVLDHTERETNWSVIGYGLWLAETCAPTRAPALRERLVRRLRLEGAGGVQQLALAVTEAKDREAVVALAKLGADVDRDGLCAVFQDIARAQTEGLNWQMRSFAAIRNTITAYGELDHDGAVVFYRSLLASDRARQREVGVYGTGELKVVEAIPELLAVLVPETENCMVASSVCVALGKLGPPVAHEALAGLLARPDTSNRMSWEVSVVMGSVCGEAVRSPFGTWENGTWCTVAGDPRAAAVIFGRAMDAYAGRTTDARTAAGLRGRADNWGSTPAPSSAPPPAPVERQAPDTQGQASPRTPSQAPVLMRRLGEAVDADAATWSTAVRDVVALLKAEPGGSAISGLMTVLQAESLRPVGNDFPVPDEATRQRLRELLARGNAHGGILMPQSTSARRAQQPLASAAIGPLVDKLIENDASTATMVAFKSFYVLAQYPESARLIEHYLTTHTAPGECGMIVSMLPATTYSYSEAACMLFLLRGDRGGYTQESLLSSWAKWREGGRRSRNEAPLQSPPRLAWILPYLLTSYKDERAAQAAARAMAEIWALEVSGEGWPLSRRAALYRAWQELPADRKAAVPELIAAQWDGSNRVVAALRTEFAKVTSTDDRAVVLDRTAAAPSRLSSLRAMMFRGTDGDWQAVSEAAAAEEDLTLSAEVATTAAQIAPERAEAISAATADRLRAAGPEGIRQLSDAILAAEARETVVALATMAKAVGPAPFRTLVESI